MRFVTCACVVLTLMLAPLPSKAIGVPESRANSSSPPVVQTDSESKLDTANTTPVSQASSGRQLKVLSSLEFWLSILVLIFGCIVLTLEYMQLRNINVTAEESLRIYAVTLIIIATLFSITAGFDAIQVAPAMGLFGTIAGYLLGKGTKGVQIRASQRSERE